MAIAAIHDRAIRVDAARLERPALLGRGQARRRRRGNPRRSPEGGWAGRPPRRLHHRHQLRNRGRPGRLSAHAAPGRRQPGC